MMHMILKIINYNVLSFFGHFPDVECASLTIKRVPKGCHGTLDGNIIALDASLRLLQAYIEDSLLEAVQHHTDLSDVVMALAEGEPLQNSSSLEVSTLIQANNATIETINELQTKVNKLTMTLASLTSTSTTTQPSVAEFVDTQPITHDPLVPQRKRAQVASVQPIMPIAFLQAPPVSRTNTVWGPLLLQSH
jgi:hypothetical protein